MKKLVIISIMLVMGLVQIVFADDLLKMSEVNWKMFGNNLENAFVIGNEGVQLSAMQNIIKYGDYLDVSDAAIPLVRIYRNHKNERVRQMAVVALHKVKNKWALYFLKRNLKFEDNPTIRRQIADYIRKNQQDTLTTNESKVSNLIAGFEK